MYAWVSRGQEGRVTGIWFVFTGHRSIGVLFIWFIFIGHRSIGFWFIGFIFTGSWVRSETDLQCSRLATLPRPPLRGNHLCLLLQVSWRVWQSTVTSMGRMGRWGGHRGSRHGERLAVLRAARVSRTAPNSGSELSLALGVVEPLPWIGIVLDGLHGCVTVRRWSRGSWVCDTKCGNGSR
jgi:hypothetical protein